MGMAAIGIALWKYVMKYSPSNPDYFNRDRFVLSNGHTCLFQYAFLHLTGYKAMTLEQLKTYHSARHDSICPGNPENEHEGIEVTTGPLGQGITNAVGLAMATKNLAATYNKPGYDLVDNTTWCMIGDACLQEGVALEAIQLAGHWKLNNLVVIYDNNQITCDGSVDLCNTEDFNAKMRACGWEVLEVEDGCYDIEGLVETLLQAKASTEKPTFIMVHTVIGVGSTVAGDAKAHGAVYGAEGVKSIKTAFLAWTRRSTFSWPTRCTITSRTSSRAARSFRTTGRACWPCIATNTPSCTRSLPRGSRGSSQRTGGVSFLPRRPFPRRRRRRGSLPGWYVTVLHQSYGT